MKVFNLGFSKTGTTSIEHALEMLGFRVCKGHFASNYTNYLLALYIAGDTKEIIKLSRYWDAFADGPWGGTSLYRSLLPVYPDAKFILTVRDPDSWYQSFTSMFYQFDSNPETSMETMHSMGRFGTTYFFTRLFEIENLANTKDKIIKKYIEHNDTCIEFFRHNKKDLLVTDVTNNDGWAPLCRHLGIDIPNAPFPHENPKKPPNQATS